jgi:uncharacterized protein (DUF1501 family)
MAITRRQFLKRSSLVAGGSFLGTGLLSGPFAQQALADTLGDRFFVVVYLGGGNDGQNTVVPVNNGAGSLRSDYELARFANSSGGIRITPTQLQNTLIGTDAGTGCTIGLHPGLAGLWRLQNQYGAVATIQGCGYPDWSLSHEESQNVFETGSRGGSTVSTGWLGRVLAAQYGSTEVPGVNIRDSVAGEFSQNTTSVLAIRRLSDFEFPYDDAYADDKTRKRDAFADLCSIAGSGTGRRREVGNTGASALGSTESYEPLHALYLADRASWNTAYSTLDTGFARRMREIAKVIYGVHTGQSGVAARYFEVEKGGFDTHSDQGGADPNGQHHQLLAEVGDAIEVFYEELRSLGIENKVCILVWSEFARRIEQNENGSDHGSQGPMFVIGGTVNGGLYGNHPNIAPSALFEDGNTVYSQNPTDPFRSTDFRDVYGTILKHWINVTPTPGILTPDTGDPNFYWTNPNFDLPFLV